MILSIATLGAATVAVIIPPVGVPLTIVTGVGAAAGIQDAIRAHAKEREQKAAIQKLQQSQKELRTQLSNLEAQVSELRSKAIDAEAIRQAKLTQVEVREDRRAA